MAKLARSGPQSTGNTAVEDEIDRLRKKKRDIELKMQTPRFSGSGASWQERSGRGGGGSLEEFSTKLREARALRMSELGGGGGGL